MFIYDNLNELEEKNESDGYTVSPLEYVVLDCGR